MILVRERGEWVVQFGNAERGAREVHLWCQCADREYRGPLGLNLRREDGFIK